MDQLLFSYWTCAGLGFTYIVGTALLGQLSSDDADAEANSVDLDADAGDVDAGDIDAGEAGDIEAGDIDAGEAGDIEAGDIEAGDGEADGNRLGNAAAGAVSRESRARSRGWYFKALSIFSPTKLAVLLFCFGATGVVCLRIFPPLGYLSLVPAAIFGYGLTRILLTLLSRFVSGLHQSTNFKQESLIGSAGKLVLGIEPGKLGEIMISTRGSRHSAPARARDPQLAIKSSSPVIICDRKDGVFIVEPLAESEF